MFYPYFYSDLLDAHLPIVLVLSARNVLYVALFAWAIVALVEVVRRPRPEHLDGDHDPELAFARVTGSTK